MNKSVFITTTDSYSGKSLVSLGVMQMILQKTTNVAYYRPIIDDLQNTKKDNHIATVVDYFGLDINYEDCYAYNRQEVIALNNEGKIDEVFEKIIGQYKKLESKFDFVVIEGTDFFNEASTFEMNLNTAIAGSLNIPMILVLNVDGMETKEIVDHFFMEVNPLLNVKADVLSVIINKANGSTFELQEIIKEKLAKDIGVYPIPPNQTLALPTVLEIKKALSAKVMFVGEIENMNLVPQRIIVGGMFLQNFVKHIDNNSLALIPGDRADLLVGTLLANRSKNYPKVAGLVLTGGLLPERSIMKLIEGIQNLVPIMTTRLSSYLAAKTVSEIKTKIQPESIGKIKTSISLFDKYVDKKQLEEKLVNVKERPLTPKLFQYNIEKEARSAQKHIVLPEGNDERILRAASQVALEKVGRLTILGDEDEVIRRVNRMGIFWDDSLINIINPLKFKQLDDFAETLYDLRKHKGMNITKAKDLMQDVSYFGTMMVYKGIADGMVSGAAHTTAHTITPSFQFIKAKEGISTVSSVVFMLLRHRVLVYGDCAIVPNPTAHQLADIAISSAETAASFGIDPKVAMLSYSSGESGTGEDVDRVRKATEIVKARKPKLKIEGPIQYDAAVSESVATKKMPDSEIAGKANVLIFPDLNTGNNTYKAVQRESNAIAIGPVLQGLKKPVNDLSRGSKVEDIYNTIIITALQAEKH